MYIPRTFSLHTWRVLQNFSSFSSIHIVARSSYLGRDYIFQPSLRPGVTMHIILCQWNVSRKDVCHFWARTFRKGAWLFHTPCPPACWSSGGPQNHKMKGTGLWITEGKRATCQTTMNLTWVRNEILLCLGLYTFADLFVATASGTIINRAYTNTSFLGYIIFTYTKFLKMGSHIRAWYHLAFTAERGHLRSRARRWKSQSWNLGLVAPKSVFFSAPSSQL